MEPVQPLDHVAESDPDREARPLVLLLEHLGRLHDFLLFKKHLHFVGVEQDLCLLPLCSGFLGKKHQLGDGLARSCPPTTCVFLKEPRLVSAASCKLRISPYIII